MGHKFSRGSRLFAAAQPICVLIILISSIAFAQPEKSDEDEFYGELKVLQDYAEPQTKSGHIPLGPVDTAMDSYFSFKTRLHSSSGFTYMIEYAPILQWDFAGDAGAHGNDELNLIGKWNLIEQENPKRGNILVWFQTASTLGNKTTTEFLQELSVLSPLNGGDTFPVQRASRMQHLSWEQYFIDNSFRIMAGKLTTRVIMNLNRYATSDRDDFYSPMFVNNVVVPYTARIGLGVFAQKSSQNWYLSGMIRDADAESDFIDFDSVTNGNWEYLGEFALTPANFYGLGEGNYRFTYSYTDPTASLPAGWSLSASFDQDLGKGYGAFFRYSYANREFRAFRQRVALGLQVRRPLNFENDRIGFGFWWADPTDSSLRNEVGVETFWKIQFASFMELTPDLQFLFNPARNPDKDAAFVGGIRFRLLL